MTEKPTRAENLTGVPETMLWTLHNRSSEARRNDGWIKDDLALSIYSSIDYPYEQSFGKANASHAVRSSTFDQAVLNWMQDNPEGTVVELGAGLETQFHRVDNGKVHWYVVDVSEAIDVREKYIPANRRLTNLRKSALDLTWLDDITLGDPTKAFISCQGLLMYFSRADVEKLLKAINQRFPQAQIMFDTIPPWFSRKTMKGFYITKSYKTPPMPWGITRANLPSTLKNECGLRVASIESFEYKDRGLLGCVISVLKLIPCLRNIYPAMWLVKLQD